jgi:hypothetical protein
MSVRSVIDEEKVKKLLDTILETIKTEADPQLLNQYRALIRKNVSFFRRSYLAAYLLMLREQPQGRRQRSGSGERLRDRPNYRDGVDPKGAEADQGRQGPRPSPQSPPAALPEDESTRLFISIGRSRRVFPREILGLIYAKTSVSKEDIGIITILNNYSFVQVRNSVAAELLEALNGISYRGKTLTVNYARLRKEEDGPEEPALKPPEQDAPYDDMEGASYDGAVDSSAYDAPGDATGDEPPEDALEPEVPGEGPGE